jgi:ribosomal protein S18 acetylase RimI-like enzyme
MGIRRAEEKDMKRVLKLLSEVLEIHAKIRPDIFVSGTTKYSDEELREIFRDDGKPVFVAVDDVDEVLGYAFCEIKEMPKRPFMQSYKMLYIDDLCVDENARGQHIGKQLYEYVLDYARKNGFYNVTLNVWNCNESAMKFYQKCGLVPQKVGMEKIL